MFKIICDLCGDEKITNDIDWKKVKFIYSVTPKILACDSCYEEFEKKLKDTEEQRSKEMYDFVDSMKRRKSR